jgi:WhiB family transcriptional regulator, redox-sensing transcriptional regulator
VRAAVRSAVASGSRTSSPSLMPSGVMAPPAWMEEARCKDLDPGYFFPDREDIITPAVKKAKHLCLGCPVREPCLVGAFENPHTLRYGIRGGSTGPERRWFLKRFGHHPGLFGWLLRWLENQAEELVIGRVSEISSSATEGTS